VRMTLGDQRCVVSGKRTARPMLTGVLGCSLAALLGQGSAMAATSSEERSTHPSLRLPSAAPGNTAPARSTTIFRVNPIQPGAQGLKVVGLQAHIPSGTLEVGTVPSSTQISLLVSLTPADPSRGRCPQL
jgi:hypothetical protein